MKIFIKSYLLLIALMLGCFSEVSTAADIEAGVVKHITTPVLPDNHPLANNLFDPSLLGGAQALLGGTQNKGADNISTTAAATGISYFEVVGVVSAQTNGVWENIQSWQTSTNQNHGGSYLYVAVLQIGYGNANPAVMNAVSKTPVLTELLCGSDLHVCNVGETVLAWLRYYDYSGQSTGNFTSSSNSTAYPFGYWSDSIYIL